MKSSTVLGDVPKHWRILRLKHTILRCENGLWGDEPTGDGADLICIRVADFDRNTDRILRKEYTIRSIPLRQRNGRLLQRGDLLLEKSGGGDLQPVGKVVLYDLDEPAVCSNFVARMKPHSGFDSRFLCYLHNALYVRRINVQCIKQNTGIQNLDLDAYLCQKVGVPPLDEQRAIVGFLDRETAKIDALVVKKERLIALLAEKRTALISHAVTKGLDTNTPMKDSGIEWLGEIPAHWSMKRLKYVASLQTGITLGKVYGDCQLVARPYLRVANVQDGYLDLEIITEIELPPQDVQRYELRIGDVLLTEGGDFDKLGRGYVWENQIQGCLHQNHIFAVRAYHDKLKPPYLATVLTSLHGKHYFTSTSQQTTNLASTNSTKLRSLPVPLPPIDEQCAILSKIKQDSDRLNNLIAMVQSGIERLREYRTAVISAAVTGKIDVRGES